MLYSQVVVPEELVVDLVTTINMATGLGGISHREELAVVTVARSIHMLQLKMSRDTRFDAMGSVPLGSIFDSSI